VVHWLMPRLWLRSPRFRGSHVRRALDAKRGRRFASTRSGDDKVVAKGAERALLDRWLARATIISGVGKA
jgi:hypothetical protein